MGSSISKTARSPSKAITNSTRKYPTRSPPPPKQPATERGWLHADSKNTAPRAAPMPEPQGADPALAARLQSIGPVSPRLPPSQPYDLTPRAPLSDPKGASPPSHSSWNAHGTPALHLTSFRPSASNPSQSIFPTAQGPDPRSNPAVSLLTARYQLAAEADAEFARTGKSAEVGRRFVDVATLRQVLVARERGLQDVEIERMFGLGSGTVGGLGVRGVVGVSSE
ncbi:hypothetical protein BJ878DRAFT_492107 [Calycina marina]|uniref:Helix-turn-helix domain-containing protein n=1 Tax=Calycina marina TaxID=1763456 RepID=A0A9P7Z8J6_9HELO|nr:hypothetical protein BJ878DRAFT_492107 [Calycina marina]